MNAGSIDVMAQDGNLVVRRDSSRLVAVVKGVAHTVFTNQGNPDPAAYPGWDGFRTQDVVVTNGWVFFKWNAEPVMGTAWKVYAWDSARPGVAPVVVGSSVPNAPQVGFTTLSAAHGLVTWMEVHSRTDRRVVVFNTIARHRSELHAGRIYAPQVASASVVTWLEESGSGQPRLAGTDVVTGVPWTPPPVVQKQAFDLMYATDLTTFAWPGAGPNSNQVWVYQRGWAAPKLVDTLEQGAQTDNLSVASPWVTWDTANGARLLDLRSGKRINLTDTYAIATLSTNGLSVEQATARAGHTRRALVPLDRTRLGTCRA